MSPSRSNLLALALGAALLLPGGPVRAQADDPEAEDLGPPGRPRREVAEQMRRLFAARLKADVGLDDAQVKKVLPEVEALERRRREGRRSQLELLRELRQGVNAGDSDASLQEKLDALDRSAQTQERATRESLARIDADLSVPQRVRLRFLIARFRGEMARRVDELRARRGAAP